MRFPRLQSRFCKAWITVQIMRIEDTFDVFEAVARKACNAEIFENAEDRRVPAPQGYWTTLSGARGQTSTAVFRMRPIWES